MTSPDGITWTSRTSAAANGWTSVTYGNGVFVAVANTGTGNRVMTSPDGITWTSSTTAVNNNWCGVTYGNGVFVAVAPTGTGNRVMTSPDGITWTIRSSAADNGWTSVTYGNGLFVAVSLTGTGNRVMTSPDGITWTSRTSAADNGWTSVGYGNNLFVAVSLNGTGNRVMTSSPFNKTTAASTTPTLCVNSSLTNITHTTTGATGIGAATGLPAGVTAAWAANTITISGTPTASGTFNYSIPLTGGCGTVNASGIITVNSSPTFTSFGSSSTAMGNSLVITGTNLTGTTSVRFGATPALFTVNSNTQITATVPRVANSGVVSISKLGGCSALSTSITVNRQSTSNLLSRTTTIGTSWNGISISGGVYGWSAPTFTDLDGDGLLDLIIGEIDGNLNHYEQNAANSTSFTLITPNFNGIDVGERSKPAFTDLDGDGLLDMIVGEASGVTGTNYSLNHYEQDAPNSTSFTLITANFNGIGGWQATFTDLDSDGLLDMMVGGNGSMGHYEQNAPNSASFTLITNTIILSEGSYTGAGGGHSTPTFTDLDGDGLLNMVSGAGYGQLYHYEQNAANSSSFTLLDYVEGGAIGSITEQASHPTITDLDGDGLLDMIVGQYNGELKHFEQTQSPIISTLSVNSACQNATVSITGIGFTGATSVTLNGTSVGTLSGVSATNITFTVPANATSGNIVVTTPSGTSNAVAMTVNVPAAVMSSSSTTAICAGTTANLTVAIYGGVAPYTVVYSGGTVSNYTSGSNIPVSPSATTNYSLTSVTDANGCKAQLDWKKIEAGESHTVGIKFDGSLWAWGSNAYGQLGDGTNTQRNSPVKIGTSTDWATIATGADHTLAIKTNGTLWAWGINNYTLGDGTTFVNRNSPVQIGNLTNWSSISAGKSHSVAIKTDGTLWAWGGATYSQVGDGSGQPQSSPVKIGTATNWSSISANGSHTLALKQDGTIWTWGHNNTSQLGDGTTANSAIPKQIGTATNWSKIAACFNHSLAIKNDGTLWGWGYNGDGELGDGTLVTSTTPKQIGTAATDWASIYSGGFFSIATKTDGTLWTWGQNTSGQLGDGSTAYKANPMQVGTSSDWSLIAGGNYHMLAAKSDGLWAWGNNAAGSLGDGTTDNKSSPVRILANTVIDVTSAGAASSTPTLCNNTVLTNITHTTTGATGIGTAIGLPAGVTAAWAANTITISGTPTAIGAFNYSIPLTDGCGSVNATGTITVSPNITVTTASSTPTLCINTPLTNITHTTTVATGIGTPTGLPAGVSAAWASNTITISGTPTASGTFNYTIPLTGGCATVNATGTILVSNNAVAAGVISGAGTVCIGNLTNIALGRPTIQSSTAHGGVASRGVDGNTNCNWTAGGITHTNVGNQEWWQVDLTSINYIESIKLWNRCDCCFNTLSNSHIIISSLPFASLDLQTSLNDPNVSYTYVVDPPLYSQDYPINRNARYVRIHQNPGASWLTLAEVEVFSKVKTLSVTGAVGAIQWEKSTDNINWTPIAQANASSYNAPTDVAGTFYYHTVVTNGACSATSPSVILTVINTVGAASSTPTLCINTPLTNINHTTTGATGIGTATGLPAGVTAAWASNVITISGTPTASGTFNYSIPLTSGCGTVNATGTITVNASPVAPTNANNGFVCGSGSTTISATPASNCTIDWYGFTPSINYSNDFNSAALNGASISGNASVISNGLVLTQNLYAQFGGFTIPSSGVNANKYNISFKMTNGGGGGADGMSYSFADDASATATTPIAENGTGTKLAICFDDWTCCGNTTGVPGIRVLYNSNSSTELSTTVGVQGVLGYSSNTSWIGMSNVPVVATISETGLMNLTVNGQAIFTNLQLPAGYLSADKSSWKHVFKARTGGSFMLHAIDDISILGYPFNLLASGSSTFTTPSIASTTSYYAVSRNLTSGCVSNTNLSVLTTVNPLPTLSASSGGASAVCVNATTPAFNNAQSGGTWSIVPGTGTASVSLGGAVTGLTAGTVSVVYTYNNGTCSNSVSSSVTVNLNTAGAASSTPTLCINNALTNITHTTTGATGIATATGLPAGVTAAWAANTITISGTPTVSGTFNYSVPLTGGCGSVNATGTITVNDMPSPPTITGDFDFCAGNTTTLSAGSDSSRQYAATVLGFSSEYTSNCGPFSSCKVLGAPNVYPIYGDLAENWANASPNGGLEYLDLGFSNPTPISFVDIYETYSPGSVTQVSVKNNTTGLYEVVYNATAAPAPGVARILHITFPLTNYDVSAVRIDMDTALFGTWIEIDAVAIGAENPDTYLWSNGQTTSSIAVTTEGEYSVTVTNADGCSATSEVKTVFVNQPVIETTVATSCGMYIWEAGNYSYYFETGTYSYTENCETHILELTVIEPTTETTVATSCGMYIWPINGSDYMTSGSYSYDTQDCVHHILELTVSPLSIPTITASGSTTFCQGESVNLTVDTESNIDTLPLNEVGGATLAVGLRKLKSDYAGSALRLRRGTDNQEQDFGFVGNDLDTVAISTWLDGADGFCTTLYDQSASGGNVTQSDMNAQPFYVASGLNNKPILHFTTTQNMSIGVNYPAPYSVIYGSRVTGAAKRMLSSVYNNWLLGYWGSYQDAAFFGDNWVSAPILPAVSNQYNIYASTGTGSVSTFYKNGVQIVSNSNSLEGPNGIRLNGWALNEIEENSDGDFTDVMVFGTELSSEDIAKLNTSISGYYSTNNTSNGALSYAWSNGATTPSINVSTAGDYSVTITNASGCSATSETTSVTVNHPTTETTVATSCGMYIWDAGNYSDYFESGTYSYTENCVTHILELTVNQPTIWYADLDTDGFGDATVTQLACSQPANYVTNNTDCDDTNSAVSTGTVITSQPVNPTICKLTNSTATVIVNALTATNATYQWYAQTAASTTVWTALTNNANYAGATGPILTITRSTTTLPATGTKYRVVINGGVCGNATSATVALQEALPAVAGTIITNTASVCLGGAITYNLFGYVGATIQWQSLASAAATSGTVVGTGPSYTASNVSGTVLYIRAVVTSGTCAPAITAVKTIVVNPTTVAGNITGAGTICPLGGATLKLVSNVGNTIQWKYSTDGVNYFNVPTTTVGTATAFGTTSTSGITTTYVVNNVTQSTWFKATVKSGLCNTLETTPVQVIVGTSVAGNLGVTAGFSNTICSGTATSLTLSGQTGTIAWQRSADYYTALNPIWTFVAGSTATVATGALSNTNTATTVIVYRANVTLGTCGTVSTAVFPINILPSAKGGTVADNDASLLTVCSGSSKTLNVTGYTGAIQWQKSTTSATATDFVDVSGAITTPYTFDNIMQSTWFRVVAKNGSCTATAKSTALAITVSTPVAVGVITAAANGLCTTNTGTTLTLAGAVGVISWMKSTDYTAVAPTWTAVTGTTTTLSTGTLAVATAFRAKLVSGLCAAFTAPIVVTVKPATTATVSATASQICSGATSTLTVANYGSGTIQWQKATMLTGTYINVTTGTGITAASYTTPALTATAYFRALITDNGCSSATRGYVVKVSSLALASAITASVATSAANAICTNAPQTLTIGASSIGDMIQWQYSSTSTIAGTWIDITNATSATLSAQNYVPVLGSAITPTYFRFKMTNSCSNARVYSAAIGVFYKNCSGPMKQVESIVKFDVVAYPNPYTDTFNLSLTTTSVDKVGVMVYDMIGKLIETREVKPSEMSGLQVGDRYPSGVYNVVVTQGEQIKTVRVVKK
jgi:alpha-tubulin suppressor-like RCC1 family protein